MKKQIKAGLVFTMALALLAGCSPKTPETTAATAKTTVEAATTVAPETTAPEVTTAETTAGGTDTVLRIGSLKGPTSMGLVSMMDAQDPSYQFTMVTGADELTAQIAAGNLDIALVPANVASVLYQKTGGEISVLDINTLGVLDIVASDPSIQSIQDLKGKTIYLTGKGTTPDYVLSHLLSANGLSAEDVTLEYKSEPTEVAVILEEQKDAIGLLPQPFVTAACAQNENLSIVLDLTKEWDKTQAQDAEKSRLVTGVTIVRNEILEKSPEAVTRFMQDHKASAAYAGTNPKETAELVVKAGIIEKAPLAEKALPYCNIVYIDGQEMKTALSGYLNILFNQDAKSVGGKLPDEAFYYMAD